MTAFHTPLGAGCLGVWVASPLLAVSTARPDRGSDWTGPAEATDSLGQLCRHGTFLLT